MSIADLRQSYEKGILLEQDAKASPFEQFGLWFDQALEQNVPEPTTMTLATAVSMAAVTMTLATLNARLVVPTAIPSMAVTMALLAIEMERRLE